MTFCVNLYIHTHNTDTPMKVKFNGGKCDHLSLTGKVFGLTVPWRKQMFNGVVMAYELPDNLNGNSLPFAVKCRYEDVVYMDDHNNIMHIPPDGKIEDAIRADTIITDDTMMANIKKQFELLNELTIDCVMGTVRALVVSGSAGCGKSTGVSQTLCKIQREVQGESGRVASKYPKDFSYSIVRGISSPIGLYQTLWNNRLTGQVTVFDDSDNILFEEDSLILLKHALDSSPTRVLSWNTETKVLINALIPREFEFNGSVIFLTNLQFDQNDVPNKLGKHLSAIMSRCYYLDLTLNSTRDKMLRIKQLVDEGMLNRYDFSHTIQHELVQFMEDNVDSFRELSPRMLAKVAQLRKHSPHNWITKVRSTCMKIS